MPTHPRLNLLGRSCALAIGLFCLLNLLGRLWVRDFDATLWLLDLRLLPRGAAVTLAGLLGLALLFLGVGFAARFPRIGRAARMLAWVGAGAALFNAAMCWHAWHLGTSHSAFPVPFSLVVMLGLVTPALWCGEVAGGPITGPLKLALGAGAAGLCAIFLQMTLFGLTDYRAPADVAVIYGARAFPDGHCSDALADRVEAGVALYKQGLVPQLLMSGGPVAGAKPGETQDEPAAMRALAMRLGVPGSAILLDPLGVSTAATADNTAQLVRDNHWRKILVVSHFYHLSRAKLTMQRAGVSRRAQVRTVPASMRGRVLLKLPVFMAREVGAFLKDWGRG